MQWAAAVILPARHPQPLGGQHQHDQRLLPGARHQPPAGGVQISGRQVGADELSIYLLKTIFHRNQLIKGLLFSVP